MIDNSLSAFPFGGGDAKSVKAAVANAQKKSMQYAAVDAQYDAGTKLLLTAVAGSVALIALTLWYRGKG